MTLIEKQRIFAERVALLIQFANSLPGHAVRFGEAYRTPEQAAINAQKGTGIQRSLHTERLAIDLLLDVQGVYRRYTDSYQQLGDYWESLSTPDAQCTWGGRFKGNPDGNHFSITHNGVK